MSLIRIGATKAFSDGWEAAFGNGKAKPRATAKKKSAKKKSSAKRSSATRSAKKKTAAKPVKKKAKGKPK